MAWYQSKSNVLYGSADIDNVISYTVIGEAIGQGQLTSAISHIATAVDFKNIINSISLTNTSALPVTGITFYLNGILAANQLNAPFTIPENGFAYFNNNGWKIYNSSGELLLNTNLVIPSSTYITKIDTSATNFTYIGKAILNSIDSDPVWQIKLIDESTSTVTILYADGTDGFIKVWNNRLTYTYS